MFEFSNHGEKDRLIFEPVLQKDGHVEVVEVGKEDFDALIQSYALECDIEHLVARATNGEPEILDRVQGMYGDFTKMPRTMAEALQLIINAQNTFDKLPQSVKDVFGNDVNKFISSLDDKDMMVKSGLFEPIEQPIDVVKPKKSSMEENENES